jgi:alkylation response protein AidB-like acyl-CoA dehydrogenase/antitoxin (DNA-binding transcriptional repressor) of toxin-antitoxin stability system
MFELNEDQRAIQEAARAFAAAELAPNSARWDEESHFPVDVMRNAAAQGFAAIYVGEEHGGIGLGRVEAALIFEALSYGDVSTAAFISIHNMASWMIDRFGSDEVRAKFLPRLTTMDLIASYCLTEPGAGSDAACLRTRADKKGNDAYVINGAKAFISGAGTSDVYVVMARTGGEGARGVSTFVVEKDTPGSASAPTSARWVGRASPLGRSSSTTSWCRPRTASATRAMASSSPWRAWTAGRLNIAACSLGGAGFALDTAIEYARTRKQFGRSLSEFQALQFKLADMATELEAARLMVLNGAAAMDRKDPNATKLCAMAKRFATDAGFAVANEALQIHGGYGYLADYPLERIVRDLRVHQILEGTNEIMRVITARSCSALDARSGALTLTTSGGQEMVVREVGVLEAKTHLSALLDAVEQRGEQVAIKRRGRVIAQLIPSAPAGTPVKPQRLTGAQLVARFKALRDQIAADGDPGPTWEELKEEIHD